MTYPTMTEMIETRLDEITARAQSTLSLARSENRPLTEAERVEHDEMLANMEACQAELRRHRSITAAHAAAEARAAALPTSPDRSGPANGGTTWPSNSEANPRHRHRPLTREQSVAAWSRTYEPEQHDPSNRDDCGLDLGLIVRGMVTGNWKNAEPERRAMSEGTATAGGYTVPTPLAVDVIDRARNMMQVIAAGARTVPMTSQTLKMARVDADPAASWHTENAAITPTDGTLGQITFTAQTLTIITVASLELFEDSENIGEVLSNSIAQSIALEWDRTSLRGSGTAPEPRGVRNQAGVTITALNGQANGATPTSYDLLIDSNQVLRAGNFEPTAYIMAPRTDTTLSKLKDSTGQPLRTPDAVAAIPRLRTNQIPTTLTKGTSTDCSDVYTGDWRHLLLGMRTGLQIRLLDQRYIDNGQFGLFAYMRGDVQLARAGAFNVTEGIRP